MSWFIGVNVIKSYIIHAIFMSIMKACLQKVYPVIPDEID